MSYFVYFFGVPIYNTYLSNEGFIFVKYSSIYDTYILEEEDYVAYFFCKHECSEVFGFFLLVDLIMLCTNLTYGSLKGCSTMLLVFHCSFYISLDRDSEVPNLNSSSISPQTTPSIQDPTTL